LKHEAFIHWNGQGWMMNKFSSSRTLWLFSLIGLMNIEHLIRMADLQSNLAGIKLENFYFWTQRTWPSGRDHKTSWFIKSSDPSCAIAQLFTTNWRLPTTFLLAGRMNRQTASIDLKKTGMMPLCLGGQSAHNRLKKFLFPPIQKVFATHKSTKGLDLPNSKKQTSQEPMQTKYAFLGVRSCDLNAIAIQDKVFLGGPFYRSCLWTKTHG